MFTGAGLAAPHAGAAQPGRQPPETVPAPLPAPAPSTVPAPTAASPPTTAPSPPPAPANLLRTPARTAELFDTLLAEGRPGDALRCLNVTQLDPEVVEERGEEYALKLAEILRWLRRQGYFEPDKLPDDPTAMTQIIGKDPLLLVITRYEYDRESGVLLEGERVRERDREGKVERRWQFSGATVADLPALYEKLTELVAESAQAASQPESVPVPAALAADDPLRSPYHAVRHFLICVANTKKDTAAYADAMACLDFSTVKTEDVSVRVNYVDDLSLILEHLRATEQFDREKLPQTPPADSDSVTVGRDPFEIILVRQADQRWRFAARTVERIPAMVAERKRRAQAEAPSGQPGPAALTPPPIRLDTGTPQGAMNLFLTAMNQNDLATAVTCLDVSELSETDRRLAPLLAGKLWMVLNRHRLIVLQDLPHDPDHAGPYAVLKHPAGRIELDRVRSGPRAGQWLFSAATVRSLERLYAAFEQQPIIPELQKVRLSWWRLPALYVREHLVPAWLKQPRWGLQDWQWIGVLMALLAGVVVRNVVAVVLPPIGRRLVHSDTAAVLPSVVRRALLPLATLAMTAVWWVGVQALDLGAAVTGVTRRGLEVVLVFIGVIACYRLTDLLMAYFAGRAAQAALRLNDVLVPLAHKTAKVLILVAGVILVAKTLGFQVGPLLAGLGLGGLAFGLAAQDTLKNFFGSINIVLDRPFQVGDWIKVGDVEGTVETVGLRSSRIRTFYNSEVTIPNAELMNARIDNMGRRRYRRLRVNVTVAYATPPEILEEFCAGIRELIRLHPYTRKDGYHAWVSEFMPTAIAVMIYCFYETPDWGTELRERQRLLLDIVRLARRLGVEFALPPAQAAARPPTPAPAPPAAAGAPPPLPAPPTAAGARPEQVIRLGAEEAARIVREAFGETVLKPPPVTFP